MAAQRARTASSKLLKTALLENGPVDEPGDLGRTTRRFGLRGRRLFLNGSRSGGGGLLLSAGGRRVCSVRRPAPGAPALAWPQPAPPHRVPPDARRSSSSP